MVVENYNPNLSTGEADGSGSLQVQGKTLITPNKDEETKTGTLTAGGNAVTSWESLLAVSDRRKHPYHNYRLWVLSK